MDNHANLSYSTVFRPPSPAASGLDLDVQAGDAAIFPLPPFNCVVCPVDQAPLHGNAEIVRVTGISDDTFTIVRAQEGTSTKSIAVGWQIFAAMTAKSFTDIEASLPPIGAVQMYLGGSQPVGGTWVLVQGGNVSRATYPEFATWAIAEGFSYDASNIHLPDMRQKFPLGQAAAGTGSTLRGTGGAIDHGHTVNSHRHGGLSHAHGVNGHNHSLTGPNAGAQIWMSDDFGVIFYGQQGGGADQGPAFYNQRRFLSGLTGWDSAGGYRPSVPLIGHTESAGSSTDAQLSVTDYQSPGTDAQNPPFIVVNYIIRVK